MEKTENLISQGMYNKRYKLSLQDPNSSITAYHGRLPPLHRST